MTTKKIEIPEKDKKDTEKKIELPEKPKKVDEQGHPLCNDGSYNMRSSKNKGLKKYDSPEYIKRQKK